MSVYISNLELKENSHTRFIILEAKDGHHIWH